MPHSMPPSASATIRSARDVAKLLDHAILHPTATREAMLAEVGRIAPLKVASLCVRPCDVAAAKAAASEHGVAVGTVIGFPHGTTSTPAKIAEARQALTDGAGELDMVINIGAALGGQWQVVQKDIEAVLAVAHDGGALLKVIFETDYVTDDAAKIRLCEICGELGVDFVKTSTGFGYVKQSDGSVNYRGATEHDVRLMRKHSPAHVGIKPSGGIRSLEDVLAFVALGATRIGTGSGAAIMAAAQKRFDGVPDHGTTSDTGHRQLEY